MSKTLFVYTSKTGAVKKCVNLLQKKVGGETLAFNLLTDKGPAPDPSGFDTIILGSSIRAGKVQKKIVQYGEANKAVLLQRKLGLFLSTMTPPEKASHYLETSFPEYLRKKSSAMGLFGGAIYFNEMNFLERFIMQKISKSTEDKEMFDEKRMDEFAERMI